MSIPFENFAELKEALSEAYNRAKQDAALNSDFKFLKGREKRLMSLHPTKADTRFCDGEWGWTGTLKDLKKAIEKAKEQGFSDLVIDSGIDGAYSLSDFSDGNYEPYAGEYELTVWVNDGIEGFKKPEECKNKV